MAAKNETFKPKLNMPTELQLFAVYYNAPREWSDPQGGKTKTLPAQLALQGRIDGVARRIIYAPTTLIERLLSLGVVETEPEQYRVPKGGVELTITRSEREGSRAHEWTLSPKNGQSTQTGSAVVVRAKAKPADPAERQLAERRSWSELRERYRRCLRIAIQVWGEEYEGEVGPDTLQAATATLCIQSSKEAIPATPPPKVKEGGTEEFAKLSDKALMRLRTESETANADGRFDELIERISQEMENRREP